jgi:hypothetical protein
MMRETLEAIATHLTGVHANEGACAAGLSARILRQLDELIRIGVLTMPNPAHEVQDDDTTMSGVYELVDIKESTGVILADLEYLARQMDMQ